MSVKSTGKRTVRRVLVGATLAALVITAAGVAVAQGRPGGGGGGGRPGMGRGGMMGGGLTGTITELADDHFVMEVQRPRMGQQGPGRQGQRQGGQQQDRAHAVTVQLTDDTQYSQTKLGHRDDIVQGAALGALGSAEGEPMPAVLIAVDPRPTGNNPFERFGRIMMIMPVMFRLANIRMEQPQPGQRPAFPPGAAGLVTALEPLTVQGMQGPQTIAVQDATRILTVVNARQDDLEEGRLVVVRPVPPPGAPGPGQGPGAGQGGRQGGPGAGRPGGGGGPGGPPELPDEVTAAAVMQFPEMDRDGEQPQAQ